MGKGLKKVVISEKRQVTTYGSREKAIQVYKAKWEIACEKEEQISYRRICETLQNTDTPKIMDSYKQEERILATILRDKREKFTKAFRLGDFEVLIVEKEYKGAGPWYNFYLVDGVVDENNFFVRDGEHLIAQRRDVFYNDLVPFLHKMVFFVNED